MVLTLNYLISNRDPDPSIYKIYNVSQFWQRFFYNIYLLFWNPIIRNIVDNFPALIFWIVLPSQDPELFPTKHFESKCQHLYNALCAPTLCSEVVQKIHYIWCYLGDQWVKSAQKHKKGTIFHAQLALFWYIM